MINERHVYLLLLILVALTGCEKLPEFGRISGTVTMDGKPLDQVRVLFLPDPENNNQGAHSACITDDDGKYDVVYSQDSQIHGAIVGWHRVVVEDIKGENNRDQVIPIRIPAEYGSSGHTPLTFEVKAEGQTFDIDIKG